MQTTSCTSNEIILPKDLLSKLHTNGYQIVSVVLSPSKYNYCLLLTSTNRKQQSVFVKWLDESDLDIDGDFEAAKYFAKEVFFYSAVISAFTHLDRPITCIPHCQLVDKCMLMFNDLLAAGYRPLNIMQNTPYEKVRIIIEQLAEFHALSMSLQYLRPDLFDALEERLLREDTNHSKRQQQICMQGLQDTLKLAKLSLPNGSVYIQKLSYFVFDAYRNNDSGAHQDLNVIIHGDLWPNNILIDESNANAVFIDFQGCRLASPTIDLMTILLLLLDKNLRLEYKDELLRYYYFTICRQLQVNGLSENDIDRLFPESLYRQHLQRYARDALSICLVGLPLYMQEQCSNNSLIDSNDNSDPAVGYFRMLRAHKSMKCKNKMLEMLMDIVDYGYLD